MALLQPIEITIEGQTLSMLVDYSFHPCTCLCPYMQGRMDLTFVHSECTFCEVYPPYSVKAELKKCDLPEDADTHRQ